MSILTAFIKFLVSVALCEPTNTSQESGKRRNHPVRAQISWTSAVLCFEKAKISERNKELFPNLNLPAEQQLSTLTDEQMSSRKAVSMASTPSSMGTRGPSARGAKREQRGKKSFCRGCLGCVTLGLVCSMCKRSEREN